MAVGLLFSFVVSAVGEVADAELRKRRCIQTETTPCDTCRALVVRNRVATVTEDQSNGR